MPMGIVSDSDFLSELDNSTTPTSISPRVISNPIPSSPESDTIPIEELDEHGEVLGTIQPMPHKGRSVGDVNVPDTLRKILADTVLTDGRASALKLAENLGISSSSVSAYTSEKTSTSSENKDEDLSQFISTRKRKLGKRALAKLALALEKITPARLEDAKVGTIASVAVSMSQIAKNLDDSDARRNDPTIVNKPVFVLYQPPMKSEDKYEVIHSRE